MNFFKDPTRKLRKREKIYGSKLQDLRKLNSA